MKVEKIIIEKELMDIPDHYRFMEFYKYAGKQLPLGAEIDIPPFVDLEKETWQIIRVYDPQGEMKRYLVKVDERELFTELIDITNTFLKEHTMKKTSIAVQLAIHSERRRIARLPWWKRLLNKLD